MAQGTLFWIRPGEFSFFFLFEITMGFHFLDAATSCLRSTLLAFLSGEGGEGVSALDFLQAGPALERPLPLPPPPSGVALL